MSSPKAFYLTDMNALPSWVISLLAQAPTGKVVPLSSTIRAATTPDGLVYLWSLLGRKISPETIHRIRRLNGKENAGEWQKN